MKYETFLVGYAVLAATLLLGCYKFKWLDARMRVVVLLLLFSMLVESSALRVIVTGKTELKNIVYHICPVVELIIMTGYFATLNRPTGNKSLIVAASVFLLVLGTVNTLFWQPINTLNTNMLMVECFSVITMCLYSIYRLLKSEVITNVFRSPHFWVSILWLVEWSSTFFFWAFMKILYKRHWVYMNLVMTTMIVVNIIVYLGIAALFINYPKKITARENQ